MTDKENSGTPSTAPMEHIDQDPGNLPQMALPPHAPNITVREAIMNVIPYWGVRRTIVAYSKAVEAGKSATDAVRELYAAMSDLEVEKVRWENIDLLRDTARNEVLAEARDSEARLTEADIRLLQAQIALEDLKTREAMSSTRTAIIESGLNAELAEAQRHEAKAKNELDDVDSSEARMSAKLREAMKARDDLSDLDAMFEEIRKNNGGELSEEDQNFYEILKEGWMENVGEKFGVE